MSEWTWDSSWGWTVLLVFGSVGLLGTFFTLALSLPWSKRITWLALRWLAILVLALCALDPRRVIKEPTPGENALVLAVDRSRSMQLAADSDESAETISTQYTNIEHPWLADLEKQFTVVQYSLGSELKVHDPLVQWPELASSSHLFEQLSVLEQRYAQRAVAGIVVFTDGSSSDQASELLRSELKVPVYPVLLSPERTEPDLRLTEVRSAATLFEASPLVITAALQHEQLADETVVVRVLDQQNRELTREEIPLASLGSTIVRLTVPEWIGELGRFVVEARLKSESGAVNEEPQLTTQERTLENNSSRLVVSRPTGPYRILYVAGRPSWEFKFLRRSVQDDEELSVLGLIRLADREPRFAFLEAGSQRSAFFEGFEGGVEEENEAYDEAVVVRIGTQDPTELAEGFPEEEAALFKYSAIVLDDIDAKFFTPDQLGMIRDFVERRGGGLLLLGGPRSFEEGAWKETAIADLAPVYLANSADVIGAESYRWEPTQEGWLAAWTRLRDSENDERQTRLIQPPLLGINRVGAPKPAATVLATAGEGSPLLVGQSFGRGRTAALTASDLHRWHLLGDLESSPTSVEEEQGTKPLGDLGRQWRQLMRWLVSDLPRRVELLDAEDSLVNAAMKEVRVLVRGADYQPDDQALVTIELTAPGEAPKTLTAVPTSTPGVFSAQVWMQGEGEYLVRASATDVDSVPVGEARSGWVWDPSRVEVSQIEVDRASWESVAERSGGRVLEVSDLDGSDWLNMDQVENVVERSESIWHQTPVLLLIVLVLVAEWWLRRRWGAA